MQRGSVQVPLSLGFPNRGLSGGVVLGKNSAGTEDDALVPDIIYVDIRQSDYRLPRTNSFYIFHTGFSTACKFDIHRLLIGPCSI
jgi:hypothetical protein